jgi:flagellar protein FliS
MPRVRRHDLRNGVAYSNSSVEQYRKVTVNSSSPLQLVIMLYDGALKFLEAARHAMTNDDLYHQNEYCKRAQDIVAELMSCLDMKQGGEVAQNLFALYTYVYEQIVAANIADDSVGIERAQKVLSELRDSWVKVEASMRTGEPIPEVTDAA